MKCSNIVIVWEPGNPELRHHISGSKVRLSRELRVWHFRFQPHGVRSVGSYSTDMASPSIPSNLEKECECSICLEIWNDPKTLPCTHIFCRGCIEPLISGQYLTCPECRTGHTVPAFGLDDDAWSTQRVLANLANSMKAFTSLSSPLPSSAGQFPSSGKVDPRQSSVETQGNKVKFGSKYMMFVKLRDAAGDPVAPSGGVDHLKAIVDLKPRPSGFQPITVRPRKLNEEYYFMYPGARCGRHEFSVCWNDVPIKDMPLAVTVQPNGMLGCEIKGPLKGPRDVVCYEDHFLVTDGIAKAVFLIDHWGKQLKKLRVQRVMEKDFAPMGIALYRHTVFVTDMGNRCIHRYDDLDAFPKQFGPPHMYKPTGITVSPDNGDVFVVDNAKKNITIFNNDGEYIKVIDYLSHRKDDAFTNPQMVEINANGDQLFVADQDDDNNSSIKVINVFESKLEKKITVKFSSFKAKPRGIAVGKDGTLYVSARVVNPDEDGDAASQGRKQKYQKNKPVGNDQKKLQQKSRVDGIVSVYDSTGYYLGSFGHHNSQLISPGGLVVTEKDGSLLAFVIDSPGKYKNGALKRFLV